MVSLLTSIGWDRRPLLFFLPEEHRPQSWLLPLPLAILQPVCLLPTALYPSFSHSPSAPNLESPSWPTSTKVLTFCKPKQPEPKASLKRILSPLVFASGYRKGEVCWGALRRGGGGGGSEAARGLVTPCRPSQKELQKAGGARSQGGGRSGPKNDLSGASLCWDCTPSNLIDGDAETHIGQTVNIPQPGAMWSLPRQSSAHNLSGLWRSWDSGWFKKFQGGLSSPDKPQEKGRLTPQPKLLPSPDFSYFGLHHPESPRLQTPATPRPLPLLVPVSKCKFTQHLETEPGLEPRTTHSWCSHLSLHLLLLFEGPHPQLGLPRRR